MLHRILTLRFLGINLKTGFDNLRGLRFFSRDLRTFKQQLGDDKDFPMGAWFPVLNERYAESGTMAGHYFHQDLLVAKRIFHNKPAKHVDIGSRIDGFVAHVASFRDIEVFDIRAVQSKISNIKFVQADFMRLQPELVGYTDSISCLHAIEHFGLGRYGDPIDAYGHVKGLNSIYEVLKKGGKFYFSTPIGAQRVEFNAHRVFSVAYLMKQFEGKYRIDSFSFVDDRGDLHENAELHTDVIHNNFGCSYGCGIFELTKL